MKALSFEGVTDGAKNLTNLIKNCGGGQGHLDNSIHIERAWVSLNTSMTLLHYGFIRFSQYLKYIICCSFKRL
jgi:hypothetical protein